MPTTVALAGPTGRLGHLIATALARKGATVRPGTPAGRYPLGLTTPRELLTANASALRPS